MKTTPICCKKISSGYGMRICGNKAKWERDGKHYCGIHDPIAEKERNDRRNEKWQTERDAVNAKREAHYKQNQELSHRALHYQSLLDALENLKNATAKYFADFGSLHLNIGAAIQTAETAINNAKITGAST